MFKLNGGGYFAKGLECVILMCDRKIGCYFSPQYCGNAEPNYVMPLCEYPEGSECYRNESQNVELVQIGMTEKYVYFGSKVQKVWEEAGKECKKEGMKLLSFLRNDTVETAKVMKLISTSYNEARRSPAWDHVTWTSGIFEREFRPSEYFEFESTNDQWSYSDHKGHWDWSIRVKNSEEERCLAIVNAGKTPPIMRPLVCDLPNYFVCFVEISDDKVSHGGGRSFDSAKDCPEVTDVCACRAKSDCQFDGILGKCKVAKKFCKKLELSSDECTRPNGHYLVGGSVCRNSDNAGKTCSAIKAIAEINLAGKDVQNPSRNITFSNSNSCRTTLIRVTEDGGYELALKISEAAILSKMNIFNVKLNGIMVLHEVNISQYSEKGSGPDLLQNFEVAKNVKTLKLTGYKNSPIPADGMISVEFCHSQCGPKWTTGGVPVCAFTVRMMTNVTTPGLEVETELIAASSHLEKISKEDSVVRGRSIGLMGDGVNTESQEDMSIEDPPEDKRTVSEVIHDFCAAAKTEFECKKYSTSCRYDGGGSGCQSKGQVCSKLQFTEEECSRPKGHYLVSGTVCRNSDDQEQFSCPQHKIIIAANLGGPEHVSGTGTKFQAGDKVTFYDPYNLYQINGTEKNSTAPKPDQILYDTQITADWHHIRAPTPDMCVIYPVPVAKDGAYELALKTVEKWSKRRSFNVKFAGMRILREVNVTQYSGGFGKRIDFYANFFVSGNATGLELKGLPPVPIIGGHVTLEFCLGDCRSRGETCDPAFVMSAFSIRHFLKNS